jgi:hypothetical protein
VQGLCLKGRNQSGTLWPITSLRLRSGEPKSKILSPLLDSRMANVLGDIFCVGAGGVDCESRELARGLGRGKVIVRNKGGLFGLA